MRSLKILFTNNTLSARAGTELWVRDMALALRARGHQLAAYSTLLGPVAEELRAAGVPVFDDLNDAPWRPDVLHCHHHFEAMTALVRFPGVPAVFICHGAVPWEEEPPLHPSVRRWIAVDGPCRERLLDAGVPADQIMTLRNFVDLARFTPRSALPDRPRRALLFGNQLNESNGLPVVRKACRREGIEMEAAGLAVGRVVDNPEKLLREFDVVFAKGRGALEAMAVGCAVILCDAPGLGPYVRTERLSPLRDLNLGFRTLTDPITVDGVRERLRGYDAADAARVSAWVRDNASLEGAASEMERVYEECVAVGAETDAGEVSRAVARYIRSVSLRVKFHEGIRHERDLLAERVRRLAIRRFFLRQ